MSRTLCIIAAVMVLSLCPLMIDLSSARDQPTTLSPLPSGDPAPRLFHTYGRQPLYFERNDGQADPRIAYLARGQGYALSLAPGEVVVALKRGPTATTPRHPVSRTLGAQPRNHDATEASLRMRLVGAKPNACPVGLDLLPGRSNYFVGNDPTTWRRNVPHYGKVRLESVYPGIDLVFYGQGRQLEHDFIVAPGVDPDQIHLAFEGADHVSLKANGDLSLTLAGGDLTLRAPMAYQDAEGGRERIPARFVVADHGRVGFEIATYDRARPLVIDPVLSYSTYLGGGGTSVDKADWGNGIAVDNAGNAYVVGAAYPADFPTTDGAFDRSGGYAGFVAKFDRNGALLYSTFLGGGGASTEAFAVAVDSTGHAYVTGKTSRTDFPATAGAFQTTCAVGTRGCDDAFVTKLSPDGSALVYSTYLGGPGSAASGDYGDDIGYGIVLDGDDNAYVVGTTRSNTFPVTVNAFQGSRSGVLRDAFVAKLNAAGSALVYGTYLGGPAADEGFAIDVDSGGHAYVTGSTGSTGFPTTAGAFQETGSNYSSAFVSKLSADGSALVYSTYIRGSGNVNDGRGIAVDAAGNAHVTGGPVGSALPTTPGSFQPTCVGSPCSDAWVLKLNPAGSALVWSTYLGGETGTEHGNAIALDGDGNVYVTGMTTSTDFPIVEPVQEAHGGTGSSNWGDAFVTKLSADGSHLIYSTFLGGSSDEVGYGIAVNVFGTAYVTGRTISTDFPTTNAFQETNAGTSDAFVSKLAQMYDLTVTKPGTGSGSVTSDPAGIDCGGTCTASVEAGTPVTLTATADPGALFLGWSGEGCSGTGTCVVTMTQARTVAAAFLAPPGAAPLTSPTGTIGTNTPPYTWTAVPTATWYYLWVVDATGTKVQTWYAAASVGCAAGGHLQRDAKHPPCPGRGHLVGADLEQRGVRPLEQRAGLHGARAGGPPRRHDLNGAHGNHRRKHPPLHLDRGAHGHLVLPLGQ